MNPYACFEYVNTSTFQIHIDTYIRPIIKKRNFSSKHELAAETSNT